MYLMKEALAEKLRKQADTIETVASGHDALIAEAIREIEYVMDKLKDWQTEGAMR
jgi:hypothetical protein